MQRIGSAFQKLIPKYEGMGDKLRAQLLGTILLAYVPVTIFLTPLFYFFASPGFSTEVIILLIALLFEIAVWRIWHSSGMNVAAGLLVLGSAIISFTAILNSGGLSSPVLPVEVFLVVMAALLTPIGVTLALVFVITGFNFYLLYLADLNRVPPLIFVDTPVSRFILVAAVLILSAATIIYSNQILKILTHKLASSERTFRALFEKTSDAVFITSLDLQLIEVNQQAADLLGYKKQELIGMPIKKLFPADEWKEVYSRFESLKTVDVLAPNARRFLSKERQEVILETNLVLVRDENGNPLHYQSTGRDATERWREEQRIKSTLVHLTVKASTDSLTGVLNRETILQQARAEWERYSREQQAMSIMLVDLDGLKAINDTYGHAAGDQALNSVARIIEKNKRPYDWVGRYGGDEFMVVLPGASPTDSGNILTRIDTAIRREKIAVGKKQIKLSAACGVASTNGSEFQVNTLDELVEVADQALYKTKQAQPVEVSPTIS